MKKIYLLLTAMFLWPVLNFAQNAESCATATTVVDGTNTVEDLTGTGGSDGGAAAWFSYTPTEGGTINIATCLQGVDTEFEVFDGTCIALNEIASGGDNCEMSAGGSNYAAAVYDVPVVSGTTYYFEFHDQYDDLGFDFEFSFVATPTCDDLSGLLISEVTQTTVTFNWNDDGNTSWDYAVDVTGFDVSLATPTNVTDTFATAGPLLSNTFYDLYVRTNCGSDFGAWEMLTFKSVGSGDNCSVPIMVDFDTDLPYADLDQTTCGRGDTYSETCLGFYDGGEDIVYEFTLTTTMNIKITFDPGETTYTGIGIFVGCPDADSCFTTETQFGSDVMTIITELTAGTYYFMASTWPSPDCITSFNLNIAEISCDDVTGLMISETTETAVSFNWNDDENTSWDYAVDVTGFDISLATPTNVTDTFATVASLLSDTYYDIYVRTDCDGTAGDWNVLTFKTVGAGDNCDVPIMVDFDNDLPYADSNQTNCGRGDTYNATCLGSYDNGEDIVYEFTLTGTMNVEITFDPDGATWYGIGIFDGCPDADNCVETVTQSGSDISTLSAQLAAGTYYFMASTWPNPNCIANFHLNITAEAVACSDITGLDVMNFTADGFTAFWNGDGNTSWDYAYGPTGFDVDTATLTTVTDTFLVITGLVPDVVYDFYFRTECGLDASAWSMFTYALPPGNDDVCSAAEVVVDGDAVTVDNSWATFNGDSASCWGTYGNGDVWLSFEFTPSGNMNGIEIISTAGTSDDSHIALYTVSGCPDGPVEMVELACSEDVDFNNFMSYITMELEAGTYYIQCGTWSGAEGNYEVEVNSIEITPPPAVEGESFEGELFVPECWTSIDADGDGSDWFQYDVETTAYAGLFSAASASYENGVGALTPDNYLVSPQLILGTDEALTYHVGAQDPAWSAEKYGVYISTAGNEEADFTTELFVETLEDGDWHSRTVDLSAYNGMTVYLAFRHYDVTDQFVMKLDNIMLPGSITGCATGIEEVEKSEFSIHPNPNNGQFTIVNEGVEGEYTIQVMEVTGKVVHNEQLHLSSNDNTVITTNDLKPGMYIVKMINIDENYYRTLRMVIK